MTWSSVNIVFCLFRYDYVLFCCTRRVSSNTCLCPYLIKHSAEMQWKIFSEKVEKETYRGVNANVWKYRIWPTADSIVNICADRLRVIATLRPSFCLYIYIFFNRRLNWSKKFSRQTSAHTHANKYRQGRKNKKYTIFHNLINTYTPWNRRKNADIAPTRWI